MGRAPAFVTPAVCWAGAAGVTVMVPRAWRWSVSPRVPSSGGRRQKTGGIGGRRSAFAPCPLPFDFLPWTASTRHAGISGKQCPPRHAGKPAPV